MGRLGCARARTLFRFCARLQAAASSAATAADSGMLRQAGWAPRPRPARAEHRRLTASAALALLRRSSSRMPDAASSSPILKGLVRLAPASRLPLDSCNGTTILSDLTKYGTSLNRAWKAPKMVTPP